IGVGLLLRARRLRRAGLPALWHRHADQGQLGHGHHHHPHHRPTNEHEHGHDHDHDHAHEHEHGRASSESPLGWRWVLAMGLAGGLVPSPSALVVLLGAIALGRTWFGVGLVVAYGAGMAVTLLVAGLVLVRARARIERVVQTPRGQRAARLLTALPLITAT